MRVKMADFEEHFLVAVVLHMVILTVCIKPGTALTERPSGLYQPIGVQNSSIIPDRLMTATSQLPGSEAYRGRLNGDGAWQPTGQDPQQLLAVDLGRMYYVFGIQTQGQGDGYVETFGISFQTDSSPQLIGYSEDGMKPKVFTGNFDNETIVQQNFTSYIYTRVILVNPTTFSGAPRLRIELLGVEELPTTSLPTTRHPLTTTKSPVTSPSFTTSATTLTSSAAETTSSSHLYPSTEVHYSTAVPSLGTSSHSQNSSIAVPGQSLNAVLAAVGGGVLSLIAMIQVAVMLFTRRREKKRTQTPSPEETSSNATGYVNASFVAITEQTGHSGRDGDEAVTGQTPSPEETSSNATGYVNASFVAITEQTGHSVRDGAEAVTGQTGTNHDANIQDLENNEPPLHISLKFMATDNRDLTWDDISLTSKLLGAGHFGEVRKGTVMVDGERIPSAIKILKNGADDASTQDFQQEVDIMRHVGYHPNIINLLGVCIYQGQQYMALEMAANGDLLNVLRNSRVQKGREQAYPGNRSDPGALTVSTLSPVQLLRIACDVASGMAHLSSKEVIHRDLAARNVLLTDSLVAKVADFGLSRGDGIYEQTSKRAIPFRSTAIEALTLRIYTTQSDVWSFGILLWEIVTLGGTPYSGMKSRLLLRRLREGYRLPKPRNCEADLYQVMLLCWRTCPEDRPTFTDLVKQLDSMIDDKHSYVDIDKDDDFEYEVVDSDDSDNDGINDAFMV